MKTTEEKAKRYDEALEKAHQIHDADRVSGIELTICEEIFPELCESEDEKIRKAIHIYLDWLDGRKDYAPKGEYSIRDMISWLEKHGEEKVYSVWVGGSEINNYYLTEKEIEELKQLKK